MLEGEGQELLLDGLANQSLDLLGIESTLCLVDEFAIADHNDLCVVALNLDHIFEHVPQTHISAPCLVVTAISRDQQQVRMFSQGLIEGFSEEGQR